MRMGESQSRMFSGMCPKVRVRVQCKRRHAEPRTTARVRVKTIANPVLSVVLGL